MNGAADDLTETEAAAWVKREIAACLTPERRAERAQIERAMMARYAKYGLDQALPNASRAQRVLIAALEG
jgi:hypothetical protein